MKSPVIAAIGILVLATAAISGPTSAAPQNLTPAQVTAQKEVRSQVIARLIPSRIRLSRAGPSQHHRFRSEFDPQLLVNDEARIPFRIFPATATSRTPRLSGYFRPSDKQVFVLDKKSGKHLPAARHPDLDPSPPTILTPAPKPDKPL